MGWSDGKVAPLHDVYGNLHFSPFGVFAYWIITPPDRPLANEAGAEAAAQAHRKLTEILPLRPGFAGTSTLKDPRFIYEQQVKGVNLREYDLFEHIATGRRLQAEAIEPRFPAYWMWVRLEPHGSAANPFRALHQRLVRAGFLAPKASQETLELYWQLMLEVEGRIPAAFAPIRPTSPQIRWFYRRQQTLGVVDVPLPLPEYSDSAVLGHRWQAKVDLDEHDLSAMLRVTSFDKDLKQESYQIHAVVESMPPGGIYFPDSNFTGLIANLQDVNGGRVNVDWAQRAHLLPLRKANRRNQKAFRKINEQYDQQTGRRTTQDLEQSDEAVSDFEQELTMYPREAEIVYTTYFTVGAPTEREARAGYNELTDVLEGLRMEIAAPVGQQKRMYRAIRPGVEDLSIQSSYAQYTSRTGWARHIPLSSVRFGDTKGRVVGLNKMSGDLDFVFVDFRGEARRVSTGGMIIGGDPRKGKTHFAMLNAAEEAVSGACVVAFDAKGEWRRFAKVVPGSAAVNLAGGEYTVDPLITIGGQLGKDLLADELIRMTGIPAKDEVASELRVLLNEKPWSSAAELLSFLNDPQHCPTVLRPLGRQLLSWSGTRAGQSLFGWVNPKTGQREPLPALDLRSVSLLVVDVQDLGLPNEEEVHAARSGGEELTQSQLIGQSVMTLFALYLRAAFYSRQTRDIIVFDEGWRTMMMKVLRDMVFEIFRTGPAANVDCWLLSQKPWRDFEGMDDDLARVRVMFTVESPKEAAAAAEWMTVDVDRHPSIAETLSTGLSPRNKVNDAFHRSSGGEVVDRDRMGECLIRIGDGELGWIKTLEMVFPEWEEAADTRPALT
ncbi:ATP-binding protein [Mycolicibacterium conceptionense]|uniref:ATP-binding protein n=1 Tax=Mycolicibacterium conceptionense TaxID=451644 RepID=UPI0032046884